VAGLSPYSPQFTYHIFGEFDVFPVPEPATWLLILIGMGAWANFSRKWNRLGTDNVPGVKEKWAPDNYL
ncbi:MAG TPA: PEP-CTERM sorting domain-containing protein, partial [Nitrosospira sp.]